MKLLKLHHLLLLIFFFTVAICMRPGMVDAVMIDGKDWRQLTDTTMISWNELDDIYDNTTGNLEPGPTSIGAVEFAGWTWASSEEVGSMFSTLTGLTIDGATYEQVIETGSSWAPEMFSLITPSTPTAAPFIDGTWGATRNPHDTIGGY